MVIQRIQTLWLLVAAILIAVFCFIPMATIIDIESASSATFVSPKDVPTLLIINSLIAVILILAIFMFKNTRRQKTLTLLSMLLIVVSGVCEGIVLAGWGSQIAEIEWVSGLCILLGALLAAILAFRGIRHDEKLLRAADRLR